MNFIRTDSQAALNSLLKNTRETLDHYKDAAELVDDGYAQLIRDIARERRIFIRHLEDAVRASGSLPTVPDPDKEAGEMLIHHVAAMIKSNYAPDVFEQRIEGEKNLTALVDEAKKTEIETAHINLLNDFTAHIEETMARLQSAQAELPSHSE